MKPNESVFALVTGVICDLAGVAIAALSVASENSGVLLITAFIMVGCGFYCSIQACKAYKREWIEAMKEKEREKENRRALEKSGNPVRFCIRFGRQLSMEQVNERVRRVLTSETGALALGKGKDEFVKSVNEAVGSVQPAWQEKPL